ncbi:hypothetical protein BsWGS_01900 [Bradybaena similaris]
MSHSLLKPAKNHERENDGLVQETTPSKPEDQVRKRQGLSLLERLGDTERRSKLLQSWMIAWAYFSLGLTAGMNGASLLDLQIITATDLESASAFFTGSIGGGMAGSLFCGIVFNKINTRLLMFTALSALGVVTIITPYCSIYALMIFIRAISGFFSGAIGTSGSALHMKIWGSDGKVLMQILHFFFALGAVLSPLYTEPFLAKRIMKNETDADNFTIGNASHLHTENGPQTTNVQYAYLVSGVFMIIASIPFVVLFIKQRSQDTQLHQEQNINIKITYRELPCCLHLFVLTSVCTFILLQSCVELTFSVFLMPFLINEYDSMTKAASVYIVSVFWVSFATSRFLMIFVSKLLSCARLLSLCLLLMMVAFTGFIISAIFEVIPAVVVFTALAGLGMSAVYPAAFSWAEAELLKVTARVAASITVTSATGKFFIPLILGFLMEEVSNMWFCYLLLGQAVLVCFIFIFLLLFNRLFINKVYGSTTLIENNIVADIKDIAL